MKIEVAREPFTRTIAALARLASSRPTLPVLANILIKTEGSRLKIAATDLEIGGIAYLGAKIDGASEVTVPARLLADFASQIFEEKVLLEIEDSALTVETAKAAVRFAGIPAGEFPLIPHVAKETIARLKAHELGEALRQILPATSQDESRPILTGILFRFSEKSLKLAATDSFRLAERNLPLDGAAAQASFVIPARSAAELGRILSQAAPTEEVSLAVEENQVLFALPNLEIISRLIVGTFPDYGGIIPQKTESEVILPAADLAAALRLASLFARERGAVTLKLGGEALEVRAQGSEVGEARTTIQAALSGPPLEISFNLRFLQDALQVIPDAMLRLGFSGQTAPATIRPRDRGDFLYLVMPLRPESSPSEGSDRPAQSDGG